MWKTLLTLISITLLSACDKSPAPQATQPSNAPLQKITVAYTYQPQSTLVHIAMEKGYFREEGLEVQAQMHTFGKAALQAVLEHQADFATVAETPVMFSILKGEKIFVISNIEASTTNNAIVASKQAGIASPADLKGKRIGFTPGTTSEFFLDSLLTVNGLTREEIQPVSVKPEAMQEAITTGQVDAVSTWNYPLTQIKRQLGANGIIFYDREIYTETFNIAAQQAFVSKNPALVKSFLKALFKAEQFAEQHPDEAQGIMASTTSIDKALIKEVWDSFNYKLLLDQTLLITLEDETRWAQKNKLTDNMSMPNYLDYMHTDSLRAVKPEAIKLQR